MILSAGKRQMEIGKMKLLRMSTKDYETWALRSKRNYASDKVRANNLTEQEAKNLGLKEIGLHVFGFNAPAIALYESLGYKTTDLVMAKTLS